MDGERSRLEGAVVVQFIIRACFVFSLQILLFSLTSTVASAQFLVDNLGDDHDMTPGDGACDINGPPMLMGDCTLRAAVEEANALPGAHSISFGIAGLVPLTNGALLVTESLSVSGQSPQSSIIRQDSVTTNNIFLAGTGNDEPEEMNFENLTLREADRSAITAGANTAITIEDCEFHDNQVSLNDGGAISSQGTVTIDRTLFSNNSTPGKGGAIAVSLSSASVTIRDSEFRDNEAASAGGAISMDVAPGILVIHDSIFDNNQSVDSLGGAISANGNVEILRSSFTNNTAGNNSGDDGGAIRYLQNGGAGFHLNIMESIFADNEAGDEGGAIFILSSNDVTILQSAFVSNEALVDGGAIAWGRLGGTHVIANSTISSNTAPTGGGMDLAGLVEMIHITVFANNGGGIDNSTAGAILSNSIVAHTAGVGTGPDCTGAPLDVSAPNLDSDTTCNASLTAADPGLAGINPSFVHPLEFGSPAFNVADNTICLAPPVNAVDQLDTARPIGPECELGALESGIPPLIKDGFEDN